MKRFRTVLFWCHLTAGLCAGAVILTMSATGAVLALQPQILALLERDVRWVEPSPDNERVGLGPVLAAASSAKPSARPTVIAFDSAPRAAVAVTLGTEGIVYVDPYTGQVLGEGARRARAIFQSLTEWHRWFALAGEQRVTARAITGACNLAFLGLAISGLYLWWPRTRTRSRFRAVMVFDPRAAGKARDFNWHNVIGFWCAPVLIVLTASGAVLSYPWANRLVYRLAGSPPPPVASAPAQTAAGAPVPGGAPREAALKLTSVEAQQIEHAISRAVEVMPTWGTISLRIPPRASSPVSITITDATHWNRFARSQLTLDGAGEIRNWEPYDNMAPGPKWRGWLRFAHTGELGGVPGQVVAGLASAGGVFLVYTGVSLALRRLAAWRRSRVKMVARAA